MAEMLIPEDVLKCTVFLGTPSTSDPDEIECRCTGFLVKHPPILSGVPGGHLYLVTAAHYAKKVEGKTSGVRLNHKDGMAITCWFSPDHKWWYHPTESDSVDVAVTAFKPPARIDHNHISTSLFATDEIIANAMIGEGDEVFFPGLFTRMKGKKRNIPIARTGNIAAIPNEPTTVYLHGKCVDTEMYLIEVRSMGGLSGSPIFVREVLLLDLIRQTPWKKGETVRVSTSGSFYFLGVMHGHWNIRPNEHNRMDWQATSAVDESIALGISLAVPAKKVMEVLNHPFLVEARAKGEQEKLAELGVASNE